MAVKFTADGQDYTRTLSLGVIPSVSVSCWWRIDTDRNTWSTPWFIDNGTGDNWGIQTANDGTTMGVVDGGTTLQNMGSAAVGSWYWTLLAVGGGSGTLYWSSLGSSVLNAVAITGGTTDVSAATLRLGESPWDTEFLVGSMTGFKFWAGVVLSAAEAAAERSQIQPMRAQSLAGYYPLLRPDPLDLSGNGRALSGGVGVTYTDGPPIPLQRIRVRPWLSVPAGGGAVSLTGKAAVADSAKATLTATRPLQGKAAASGSAKATALVARPLTAKAAAAVSVKASLTATRPLSGKAAAASSAKADLSIQGQTALAGAAAVANSARASLSINRSITGRAAVSGSTKATLGVQRSLVGSAAAASGSRGVLGAIRGLVGRAAASSGAIAIFRAVRALSGKAPSAASARAELYIGIPIVQRDITAGAATAESPLQSDSATTEGRITGGSVSVE